MKELDKCKNKLKRWKWLNKHIGNLVLSIYLPTITLYFILTFFSPIIGLPFLLISFLTATIGGITKLWYADEEKYKVLYEQQIKAMETATKEKAEILEKRIEYYKENPTLIKDKKKTKSLIKYLIKIHLSVEKTLQEERDEKDGDLTL